MQNQNYKSIVLIKKLDLVRYREETLDGIENSFEKYDKLFFFSLNTKSRKSFDHLFLILILFPSFKALLILISSKEPQGLCNRLVF